MAARHQANGWKTRRRRGAGFGRGRPPFLVRGVSYRGGADKACRPRVRRVCGVGGALALGQDRSHFHVCKGCAPCLMLHDGSLVLKNMDMLLHK